MIILNTQKAIIDENTWLKVQKLRAHSIRLMVTGRKAFLSWSIAIILVAASLLCSQKPEINQKFFRYSQDKDGRATCTIHFVRDVVLVLDQIVTDAVSGMADFVNCYEPVFSI